MERLKKVASSSSRVIASLQQAASEKFNQQATTATRRDSVADLGGGQQVRLDHETDFSGDISQPAGMTASDDTATTAASSLSQPDAAQLIASKATAHLTDEEREILLQVFRREEQFRQDTLKQMNSAVRQQRIGAPGSRTSGEPQSLSSQANQNRLWQQQPTATRTSEDNKNRSVSFNQSPGSSTTTTGFSRPGSSGSNFNPQMQSVGADMNGMAPSDSYQSTSSSTTNTNFYRSRPESVSTPLVISSQCRICRKLIAEDESYHLCSNCNQFICEDCASYSSTEQNWTCSSCRRWANKPDDLNDTLRDLGIAMDEKNSFALAKRRMTIRASQAEFATQLPAAIERERNQQRQTKALSATDANPQAPRSIRASSSESKKSNSTSSEQKKIGQAIGQPTAKAKPKHLLERRTFSSRKYDRQQIQRQHSDTAASRAQLKSGSSGTSSSGSGSSGTSNPVQHAAIEPDEGANRSKASLSQPQEAGGVKSSASERLKQKQNEYLDQTFRQMSRTSGMNPTPMSQDVGSSSLASAAGRSFSGAQSGASTTRRASVAVPEAFCSLRRQSTQANRASTMTGSQAARALTRKQSIVTFYAPPPFPIADYTRPLYAQQQSIGAVQAARRQSIRLNRQDSYSQPSDPSRNYDPASAQLGRNEQHPHASRAITNAAQNGSQQSLLGANGSGSDLTQQQDMLMIPIPPDQIHLRRLSDQSNLVRRSSIIADTLDVLAMTRNRSHSNIDSIAHLYKHSAEYGQQFQHQPMEGIDLNLEYQDEAMMHRFAYGRKESLYAATAPQHQQSTPSDSWSMHQHEQQQLYQHQQAPNSADMMSSIITPYAKKQQQSQSQQQHQQSSSDFQNDDVRSDSSSDIGEENDIRAIQTAYERSEQPNDYFAPPRPLSSTLDYAQMLQLDLRRASDLNQNPSISIPSVSVSEFQTSQQKLNYQQPQSSHNPHSDYEQIMTTPMQINVAIERAIEQQEQRQSIIASQQSELFVGLTPDARRGSSGRVLPRIPGAGEQTRSLLDLPHHEGQNSQSTLNELGLGGLDQLGIPGMGGHLRRASAPEGQNIKIVVDDMDGSKTPFMKQGDLFERLVLYRDDSIDPNTNLARGFGLQIMGGKIDSNGEKLEACITWILPSGPADKVGLKVGDRIIEWDAKCLVDMSYEQVSEVIESSGNIAELVVRPMNRLDSQPGAHYVRSGRRLSQQTERDLRRAESQIPNASAHSAQAESPFLPSNWHYKATGVFDGSQKQSLHKHQQHESSVSGKQASHRSGTGRRLPQIPNGPIQYGQSGPHSAGLVDSIGYEQMIANGFNAGPSIQGGGQSHLGILNQSSSYQSRSASELNSDMGNQIFIQQHLQAQSYQLGPKRNSTSTILDMDLSQHFQKTSAQINGIQTSHPRGQFQSSAIGDNQLRPNSPWQEEVTALIGLQVNVDEKNSQMDISLLSAINVNLDLSFDYYVRLTILPESNRFKPCSTQPSSDLSWKETFIFQNFPLGQIHRMGLEVALWIHQENSNYQLTAQPAQPVCATMISLQSARDRNTDFWPLRATSSSIQLRRKSLNDLIESSYQSRAASQRMRTNNPGPRRDETIGYQLNESIYRSQAPSVMNDVMNSGHGQSRLYQPSSFMHGASDFMARDFRRDEVFPTRERSNSNRNVTILSDWMGNPKRALNGQVRRASDEIAGSSKSRSSSTRVSPAASRRSKSVVNVNNDPLLISRFHGSGSKRGSQTSIPTRQAARDSIHRQNSDGTTKGADQNRPVSSSSLGGPIRQASRTDSRGNLMKRQPSLVGSSRSSHRGSDELSWAPTSKSNLIYEGRQIMSDSQQSVFERDHQASDGVNGSLSSLTGSQRDVAMVQTSSSHTERSPAGGLQRKDSLARITLRKLKRNMSFNKGNQGSGNSAEAGGENMAALSRRSSSSSNLSVSEMAVSEDLGVTSRVASRDVRVGRLKLGVVMTKGQLEVEIIFVKDLKLLQDPSSGIYVKIYIKYKEKGRGYKRKTRTVNPSGAGIFQFKQVIKYDASLVDNKVLEISVWQRKGGLKSKLFLGMTEIRIRELNLTQVQKSWYNLRPIDSKESSSLEDSSY